MTFRSASGSGGSRSHFSGIQGFEASRSPVRKNVNRARSLSLACSSTTAPEQHAVGNIFTPVAMDTVLAEKLRHRYTEKVTNSKKFELVAGFLLDAGIVQSLFVYREGEVRFELTERRRRLLARYYTRGRQAVVLYTNHLQFEHYMPLQGIDRAVNQHNHQRTGGGGARVSPSRTISSVGDPEVIQPPARASFREDAGGGANNSNVEHCGGLMQQHRSRTDRKCRSVSDSRHSTNSIYL